MRRRPMRSPPGRGRTARPVLVEQARGQQEGAANGAAQFAVRHPVDEARGVDGDLARGLVVRADSDSEVGEDLELGLDVLDARDVRQPVDARREERGGEDRQRLVLVARRLHAAADRSPAFDDEAVAGVRSVVHRFPRGPSGRSLASKPSRGMDARRRPGALFRARARSPSSRGSSRGSAHRRSRRRGSWCVPSCGSVPRGGGAQLRCPC